MRERIAPAKARIHVKHEAALVRHHHVAIDASGMCQILPEGSAQIFKPGLDHTNGAIRVAATYCQLSASERCGVLAFQIINHVDAVLLPFDPFLDYESV